MERRSFLALLASAPIAALSPMPAFLRGMFAVGRGPDGYDWHWYPPFVAPQPFVFPEFCALTEDDPWTAVHF